MAELTDAARDWLRDRHQAVLITLRKDGSPQSSNISYTFDGSAFRISVTDGRAKTRNARRDPRAVLHVLGDDFWSFASVTCAASLSDVSMSPGDAAGQALLDTYNAISENPHPDPDEFFAVMTAEHRLVLTLTPTSIVGSGWA